MRRGAGQAEDAGGIEQGQDEDQQSMMILAEDGQQHQREDQHRDRQEGIDDAREIWSSQPRLRAAKNAERAADDEGQERGASAMPMVLRAP